MDFNTDATTASLQSGASPPKPSAEDDAVFWMDFWEEIGKRSELGGVTDLLIGEKKRKRCRFHKGEPHRKEGE